MLGRYPKSKFAQAKTGLKFFLIAEGAIFLTSYLLYAACNRSQTTRKFFHDTPGLNLIVEFYYKIGEFHGTTQVRDFDIATWSAQRKLAARGNEQ